MNKIQHEIEQNEGSNKKQFHHHVTFIHPTIRPLRPWKNPPDSAATSLGLKIITFAPKLLGLFGTTLNQHTQTSQRSPTVKVTFWSSPITRDDKARGMG